MITSAKVVSSQIYREDETVWLGITFNTAYSAIEYIDKISLAVDRDNGAGQLVVRVPVSSLVSSDDGFDDAEQLPDLDHIEPRQHLAANDNVVDVKRDSGTRIILWVWMGLCAILTFH